MFSLQPLRHTSTLPTAAIRGRPGERRLLALRRPSIEPVDRRLAGVKLTRSLRCRTAAPDPKPTRSSPVILKWRVRTSRGVSPKGALCRLVRCLPLEPALHARVLAYGHIEPQPRRAIE